MKVVCIYGKDVFAGHSILGYIKDDADIEAVIAKANKEFDTDFIKDTRRSTIGYHLYHDKNADVHCYIINLYEY